MYNKAWLLKKLTLLNHKNKLILKIHFYKIWIIKTQKLINLLQKILKMF